LYKLLDQFLPDQSGYGVFYTQNVLCVVLLWCSGFDALSKRAMIEGMVHRDSQGDEDSRSERPVARTALVDENEIIDEDSEPSEQSMELCPHEQPARPRPSGGSSS